MNYSIYIYIILYIMYFNGPGDFIYPVGKGRSRSELGVSIFLISHAESVGVTIRGFQAYDSYWIQWDMAVYILLNNITYNWKIMYIGFGFQPFDGCVGWIKQRQTEIGVELNVYWYS